MVAMACAIAFMAAFALRDIIVKALDWAGITGIPLVGGALRDLILKIADGLRAAGTWLWTNANPINLLVGAWGWLINTMVNTIGNNFWTVYSTLQRVFTVAIPNALNAALNYAASIYNAVVGYVAAQIAGAERFAQSLYNAAVGIIAADVASLEAQIINAYNTLARTIGDDVRGIEAGIATTIAGVEAWASGIINTVEQSLLRDIDGLRIWTQGELGSIRGYLAQTIAPGIAAAMALATAVATDWFRWKKDCGDPLCNNLSNFGNDIAALEQGLGDVAIIALLIAAVADPGGVASEVQQLIGGPVQAVADTVTGATGLPRAA